MIECLSRDHIRNSKNGVVQLDDAVVYIQYVDMSTNWMIALPLNAFAQRESTWQQYCLNSAKLWAWPSPMQFVG